MHLARIQMSSLEQKEGNFLSFKPKYLQMKSMRLHTHTCWYSCVCYLPCNGRIIVDLQGLETMSKRTPGTRAQSVSQWNTANSHLMPPHGPCPPSSPRWRTHSTPCHPCSIALYISYPSSHPFPCALSAVGLCWKQASGVGHVIPPAAPGASSGLSTRWTCPQRLSEEVSRKNLGRNMLPPQRAGDPTPTYSHCLNKADTEPLGSQVACTRALLSLQLKIQPVKTINVVMNHIDFLLSEVTALIVLRQTQIRPQQWDMYTIFPWMSFSLWFLYPRTTSRLMYFSSKFLHIH